jgi:hypothetical protein
VTRKTALRTSVAFVAVRRRAAARWLVTWRIGNGSALPITVIEAWHPHGRFRSSRLRRSLRLAPGAAAELDLPARIDAKPGDRVENCFLILRVARGRERWRVLARFTLIAGDEGTPRPRVEAIAAHPAER